MLLSITLLCLGAILGSGGIAWNTDAAIVFDIRLPRSAGAWLAGALLGLAGAIAQGVFRNPLADPYLLGSASGALMGVALVLGFSQTISNSGFELIGLNSGAFIGALLGVVAALILAGVGVFTFRTVFDLSKTSDTQMVVNVTGQQWWWEYDYPAQPELGITAPIITSGQMIIPVGTKVLLPETSRDFIHSYWIPALNGKRDAVPGRVHTLRLDADKPGIYAGQCTEFCGLSHANMRMETVALSKEDFAAWVANQLTDAKSPAENTLAKEGEAVFLNQCVRCHQVNGLKKADGTPAIAAPDENVWSGAAPNLTHLMSRNTFAGASWDLLNKKCRADVWGASSETVGKKYLAGVSEECLNQTDLRRWLRNSPAMKPMYADPTQLSSTNGKYRGMPNLGLSEDDIDKLVAYLSTLK
jgi:cytochrome c oxidase subunit 2